MSRRVLLVLTILMVTSLLLPLTTRQTASAQGLGPQVVDIPELEQLHEALPDFDARTMVLAPTAGQLSQVSALGAHASWNRFGTPKSLIKYGDFLATGLSGDAPTAAREWIRSNRSLFRLSNQAVTNLEMLSDVTLTDSSAHVVLFRQLFGGIPAVQDGMISVAIQDGNLVYVSSSAVGDSTAPGSATLTPEAAWLAAATNVELAVSANLISNVRSEYDWTLFDVAGFSHPQRARLRVLPMPGEAARLVYEVNVLNVQAIDNVAYTLYVDAQSGAILFRQSRLYHLDHETDVETARVQVPITDTFSGSYVAPACGQRHTFDVPQGTTRILVSATTLVVANDIVLNLYRESDGQLVAANDTLTSPEAIVYAPVLGVEAGLYSVEVCPFEGQATVPRTDYTGTFTADDTPLVEADLYNPKWRFFTSNPPLDYSSTDTRILGCWNTVVYTEEGPQPVEGCDLQLRNASSPAPWDYEVRANVSTETTIGNNALSATAWFSPLTPSEQYRPISVEREYDFPWTNQWSNNRCAPTVFVTPQAVDRDAAVTNLFVAHNNMHDWSYKLGFQEETYNAQSSNFGRTPPIRENDAEVGNVQAGAVDGGYPSYLGRDNANQITLQDGIPPITNMYLWQPIAGVFYAPCVDGDYDMSVIGHEYTHLISNRMVGGPDSNLTGLQAGAMGESWADQAAVEYLNEYSYVPLNQPNSFAVGGYVTGNANTGIRNYNMSSSPLNYSDVGYDLVGPQVHADGEIWSATNYDIRQMLVAKYNSRYNASDADLQRQCANGFSVQHCPGNRRWIQIVFDAWLLMPPGVSMLDARDAYLAADMMRFGGANQGELWLAFARRGMGVNASSNGSDDSEPTPNFESPLHSARQLTFELVAGRRGGTPIENAKIFVGRYEARATEAADTDPATALSNTISLVPGSYELLIQAPGFGHQRLTLNVTRSRTYSLVLQSNWASEVYGSTATGNGLPSGDVDRDRNLQALIDDTEETNWARSGRVQGANGSEVTVDLNARRTIRRVQVSAMLRPEDPNDPGGDVAAQNRFTALRSFEILACNETVPGFCDLPANFTSIYTSAADAFPGTAPRPLAPQLIIRSFDVPLTQATHVRLRVLSNQCTGNPAFHGEQDNDPLNPTDCPSGSTADETVRAAELQLFSR